MRQGDCVEQIVQQEGRLRCMANPSPQTFSHLCSRGRYIFCTRAEMTPLFWILHSSSGCRADEPDRVATSNYALWCVPPNTSATNEASQLISSLCFKHRWDPWERIAHSSVMLLFLLKAWKLHGPQWEHCWEDPMHRTQCWQHIKCSTLVGAGTLGFLAQ